MSEKDIRGIAVHLAARIASEASANEVFASRTVRDLVAGSGINFRNIGARDLAGFSEPMEIYAAES